MKPFPDLPLALPAPAGMEGDVPPWRRWQRPRGETPRQHHRKDWTEPPPAGMDPRACREFFDILRTGITRRYAAERCGLEPARVSTWLKYGQMAKAQGKTAAEDAYVDFYEKVIQAQVGPKTMLLATVLQEARSDGRLALNLLKTHPDFRSDWNPRVEIRHRAELAPATRDRLASVLGSVGKPVHANGDEPPRISGSEKRAAVDEAIALAMVRFARRVARNGDDPE